MCIAWMKTVENVSAISLKGIKCLVFECDRCSVYFAPFETMTMKVIFVSLLREK